MKRQDETRLAAERECCRTRDIEGHERCVVSGDAARIVTLGQLWGVQALVPGRSAAIAPAVSTEELHGVGRLRYEVFVEHGCRDYAHADHAERVLIEPIDAVSLNLRVISERGCLAAIRLTQGADAVSDPDLAAMLRRSGLAPSAHADCLVLSQMAARPESVARTPIVDLGRHAYRTALLAGTGIALLAAGPALAGWFGRFGFKPSGRSWTDPVAGEQHCLVLDIRDRTRLEAVDLPLLAELDAFEAGTAGTPAEVSILDLAKDL